MAIPESQLETWAHQGAVTTAKLTADSIKNALDSYNNWPDGIDFEVYLQGSYKNDTNIRSESDVDVIAQLNSTFYSNLLEEQKSFLGLSTAVYNWPDFRSNILLALKNYYGEGQVEEGNKSIKVKAGNGRLPADVMASCQYRKYRTVDTNDYVEGMCFWTIRDDRKIINYPKFHYDNGSLKHQNSNSWYKPTVRLFKNIRNNISGDVTPSYFLECMLYNIPNSQFGSSCGDTFCNVVNWLNENDLSDFFCQNGQLKLFGLTPEHWNMEEANLLIRNLISLWNNW